MGMLDGLVGVAVVGGLALVGYEVVSGGALGKAGADAANGALDQAGKDIASTFSGLGNSLNSVTTSPGNGQNTPAFNAGSSAGTAAGQAVTGGIAGIFNSVWLGGKTVCDYVDFWRKAGAPNASFLGFNVPFSGGGDLHDYNAFRNWMHISVQFDPGDTPPSCWDGGNYGGGSSGFSQGTYEGLAPGGLGY